MVDIDATYEELCHRKSEIEDGLFIDSFPVHIFEASPSNHWDFVMKEAVCNHLLITFNSIAKSAYLSYWILFRFGYLKIL